MRKTAFVCTFIVAVMIAFVSIGRAQTIVGPGTLPTPNSTLSPGDLIVGAHSGQGTVGIAIQNLLFTSPTVDSPPTQPSGAPMPFFGDSLTAGTGSTGCNNGVTFTTGSTPAPYPSPTGNCYADLVAAYYGGIEYNAGISGSSVEAAGYAPAINRYTTDFLPLCTSNAWPIFTYGINDVRATSNSITNSSFNPTQFGANVTTILTACISHGTPASHIKIVSMWYADPASYALSTPAPYLGLLAAHEHAFNRQLMQIAFTLHTQYADAYDETAQDGGVSLTVDGLHLSGTNGGTQAMATAIENARFLTARDLENGFYERESLAGGYTGGVRNNVSGALIDTGVTSNSATTIASSINDYLILNSGLGFVGVNYGNGQSSGFDTFDGGTVNFANLTYTNGLTWSGTTSTKYGPSSASVAGPITSTSQGLFTGASGGSYSVGSNQAMQFGSGVASGANVILFNSSSQSNNGVTAGVFGLYLTTAGNLLSLDGSGNLGIAGQLSISPLTPADNTTCSAGKIWVDAAYVYVCTATNTVKRTALSSF